MPQAGLFARKDRTSQSTIYYGTTSGLEVGLGTVFKLTGQTLTPIWDFTGGSDGSSPQAGLITDERGVLYGTAGGGGASNKGVVFQLTPPNHGQTAWSEQTLWSFSGGNFMHGVAPVTVNCPAINGIIKEADEIAGEVDDTQVLYAALIAAAQAVDVG